MCVDMCKDEIPKIFLNIEYVIIFIKIVTAKIKYLLAFRNLVGALRVIPGGNQVDGLPPAPSFLQLIFLLREAFVIDPEVLEASKN